MFDFIAKNIRYWASEGRPPASFVRLFNLTNWLAWRLPVRLRYDAGTKCMVADDGRSTIYFCRNSRVNRYRQGIDTLLDKVASDYMIGEIRLSDGDWVVDCGANVGEVSLWIKSHHPGVRFILVEPEGLEATCADMNIFGGKPQTVRTALWKHEGELSFYRKPNTADGSLFEMPDADCVAQVSVTTLANLLNRAGVGRVRLLKLEAEGAEPEIIQGCGDFLAKIDYIAADCGPERGLSQEETATDLINFLLARNFDLVNMKFDRVVCLFRNRNAYE